MGYLYERVAAGRVVVPGPVSEETARLMTSSIDDAVVIHARSALDYFHEETSPEEYLGIEDMPYIDPPFDPCWIESGSDIRYIWGAAALPEAVGDYLWASCSWSAGLLFRSVDIKRCTSTPSHDWIRRKFIYHCGQKQYDERVKRAMIATLYAASPIDAVVTGPLVQWIMPIDVDGSVQCHMNGWDPVLISLPLTGFEKGLASQRAWVDSAVGYLTPALFAFAATNSPLTELAPLDGLGSRRYELKMERLKEALNDAGKASQFGLRRALQVCRGSFSPNRQSGTP